MAIAKLQPLRCCAGLLPFVPSAFRCFSSQPLQSPSKCWQVSSMGRVCSTKGVISRGMLSSSGYFMVKIVGQNWPAHRVVKLTHHGTPPDHETWQVHHRDGNKSNNAVGNLEYVTPRQNQLYSYAALSRRNTWHIQSRPVMWRVIGGDEWACCPSLTSVAKQLGMKQQTVSRCCHSDQAANGYEFQFKDLQQPDIHGEEWRPMLHPNSGLEVPGRSISSFGRMKGRYGHISRGCLDKCGYYVTGIGRQAVVGVHRIVAFTFLGPPTSHKQSLVNHKDLDKGNNAIENLEYVTPAENQAHFHSNVSLQRTGGLKPVWSRLHGSRDGWRWHASTHSAARSLALNAGNIAHCLSNRRKHTGGYEFQFANAEPEPLPGELWREVDVPALLQDRERRR